MDFTLYLGASRMGTELTWSGASNSHLYISGQSGRGKSFFLRHCIVQLPRQGVRCIVFDYGGDLHPYDIPCNTMDVRAQVGVNPFRPLLWGENCRERPYDTAVRVAEVVISVGSIRGSLQQVGLRNVLKDYIARGDTRSGFSGLVSQIQNDPELARTMAPTLLRLQDLDNLLPSVSQDFSWGLEQPGITVLHFDTLPNLSAQTFMTQFLLFDLWSEKLSRGESGCPVVVVLDECQRFRFTENSIFARILREGRKYHFSGWFASQWISDKGTVEALSQAALQAYFYPGDNRVNALAKRLAHGTRPAADYRTLLRSLRVGEFLYTDFRGSPIINCVPSLKEGQGSAQYLAKIENLSLPNSIIY